MKLIVKICLIGILLVGGGLLPYCANAQDKYKPKYLREDNKAFRDLASNVTENGWVEFRKEKEAIDPDTFFDKFGDAIGLAKDYQMRLISDETDFKEIRHQRYQLYYKSVPVEHAQYYLHSKHKRLNVADGRIVENINLDVSKPMPESKALDFALTDQKLTIDNFKTGGKLPKGELLLARIGEEFVNGNFRYCYAFDVRKEGISLQKDASAEPYRIYVDASSGEVVRRYPLRHNCFHGTTVGTDGGTSQPFGYGVLQSAMNAPMVASSFTPRWGGRYGSTRTFETEATGMPNQYRLSHQNGALITRSDVNGNGNWANNGDVTNTSIAWGTNFQTATAAHWLTQNAHSFIRTFAQDQNGINRQGAYPRVLVDLATRNLQTNQRIPLIDAFWDGNTGQLTLGYAPLPTRVFRDYRVNVNNPFLSADILGHEYMHAVTQNTVPGGLTYDGESGALNESISDIFGTAFERYLFPNNWNWDCGEDAYQVRDMANPRRAFAPFPPDNGQPVRYLDTVNGWQNTTDPTDNGGVHVNSGVMNKWFNALYTGNGANGQSVTPIAFDDATNIVYRALRYYFQSGTNYPNAFNATKQAAADLYGECSPQQRTVIAAWKAGNVGTNYAFPCDPGCDFIPTISTVSNAACNQTVTFNAGCNTQSNIGCNGVNTYFYRSNFDYLGSGPSLNVTMPPDPGNYAFKVGLQRNGCYGPIRDFTINVNCTPPTPCDFSTPRYVGTWNGLTVQIRSISGKNVLVTAITGSSTDKYYPRGDNFWYSFTPDPNVAGLQSCLNAGNSGWYGASFPGGLNPPPGYTQGQEADGAIFFTNGGSPPNPCDLSSPRQVGTWNGLMVQIRQFPNNKRALVTAVAGSSNDKYYPRGDNFWDNFTKDSGADQYRVCLNAGETGWYGLSFPGGISPPAGYQQGTTQDGATFFSTNGQRVAALAEPTIESVALVKVRPNPAQDELTVTFMLDRSETVPIRLLDMQGRAMQQQTVPGMAGQNERVLNVSALPTGLYMLEVRLGTQRIMLKVVKE